MKESTAMIQASVVITDASERIRLVVEGRQGVQRCESLLTSSRWILMATLALHLPVASGHLTE